LLRKKSSDVPRAVVAQPMEAIAHHDVLASPNVSATGTNSPARIVYFLLVNGLVEDKVNTNLALV
jgi:hypothetical protein